MFRGKIGRTPRNCGKQNWEICVDGVGCKKMINAEEKLWVLAVVCMV